MSIKTKIITTIVCICCVVSAMVVGILAASNHTFNMGATVHFTSSEIAFDLKYATAGNVVKVNDSDEIFVPEEYGGYSVGKNDTTKDWEIGRLDFDGIGSPIYIEIIVGLHPEEIVSR